MRGQQRKRIDQLDGKITIAGRIHAVYGGAVETQVVGNGLAIQRKGRSRHRSGTQRTQICALAAIRQPLRIAAGHLDISQQPVCNQHRLSALQVRISRHDRIAGPLRARHQDFHPIGDELLQLIDAGPGI